MSDIPTTLTNTVSLNQVHSTNQDSITKRNNRKKNPGLQNSYDQSKNQQSKSSKNFPRRKTINKIDLTPSKEEWTYSIGNKVKHPTFGDGIVISIEGSGPDPVLTIAFKNKHGIKKLLASMAKLKKL